MCRHCPKSRAKSRASVHHVKGEGGAGTESPAPACLLPTGIRRYRAQAKAARLRVGGFGVEEWEELSVLRRGRSGNAPHVCPRFCLQNLHMHQDPGRLSCGQVLTDSGSVVSMIMMPAVRLSGAPEIENGRVALNITCAGSSPYAVYTAAASFVILSCQLRWLLFWHPR